MWQDVSLVRAPAPHSLATSLRRKRILAALEKRREGRPYNRLALDIGISHGTLLNMHADRRDPGLETLAVLLHWDEELEPLIIDYLRELGRNLRTKVA